MPELPDQLPGEIIEADTTNAGQRRMVQRYTDAAQRSALNPTPEEGDFAYLADTDNLTWFNGVVWEEALPLSGGQMTGILGFTAGAIDTVLQGFQTVVRNPNTGEIQRYNVHSDVVPLTSGNTGDARLEAAAQMVTISFVINVDTLDAAVGTIPAPYRPPREYYFNAVLRNSSGVTVAGQRACRVQVSGGLRIENGDSLPAGGVIIGTVSYPWSG